MKLKKIVSLMLAGVMAVSMLAGCSGNPDPNPGEGEGEGNTTGYTSIFHDYLTDAAKDVEYISYSDSAALNAQMKYAVDFLGTANVTISGVTGIARIKTDEVEETPNVERMVKWFIDDADIINANLDDLFNKMNDEKVAVGETDTVAAMWMVDGTVMGVNNALETIAEEVSPWLVALNNTETNENKVDYSLRYNVSVSVQPKTFQNALADVTVNVIVVTITRTATAL